MKSKFLKILAVVGVFALVIGFAQFASADRTNGGSGGGMSIGGAVTSGTSKSILYINSLGNLGQDNTNFVYDAVNIKVGIGSSSPSEGLSVVGGILGLETAPATSTSMTLDLATRNQFLVQMGTSATTITLSDLIAGQAVRVIACNPGATASTITWATSPANKILWPSAIIPTQTTTANKCDVYTFTVTQATSTVATSPIALGGYVQNF